MFETSFFSNPGTLVMGAITGLVFGFLLQKGRVTKFDTIVGQFLLTDFTVAKVMFTAIVVGSIGIYAMLGFGLIDSLHVKSATLLGNALGGCIFGVGMAILGYCPGTGVAALGDGAKDAVFGILGMFVGAALYAETYPWLKGNVLSVANLGKETLPTLSGVSPWLFVGALLFLLLAGSQFLKRLE